MLLFIYSGLFYRGVFFWNKKAQCESGFTTWSLLQSGSVSVVQESAEEPERRVCMRVFVYTSDIKYCCVHCLSARTRSRRTGREAQLTVVYYPSREPVQPAHSRKALAGPAGLGFARASFFLTNARSLVGKMTSRDRREPPITQWGTVAYL